MINMKNQLNKMKWGPFLTKTKKDSIIRKGNIIEIFIIIIFWREKYN